jgi:hypothetical protein
VCETEDKCANNRKGIKCFDCEEGFGSSACIACPESSINGVLYFIVVLGAMASLAYLHHCTQQPEMAKTLTFLIEHCQLLSIAAACDLKWSCAARQMFEVLSISDFSVASTFGSSCALNINYYWKLITISISPLLLWLLGISVAVGFRSWKKHLYQN